MTKQRWKTPTERTIAEVMGKASDRLRELYPGGTLTVLPMSWSELVRGEQISPTYFFGLISVTKLNGQQISYSVRWHAREEKGVLSIEK